MNFFIKMESEDWLERADGSRVDWRTCVRESDNRELMFTVARAGDTLHCVPGFLSYGGSRPYDLPLREGEYLIWYRQSGAIGRYTEAGFYRDHCPHEMQRTPAEGASVLEKS